MYHLITDFYVIYQIPKEMFHHDFQIPGNESKKRPAEAFLVRYFKVFGKREFLQQGGRASEEVLLAFLGCSYKCQQRGECIVE